MTEQNLDKLFEVARHVPVQTSPSEVAGWLAASGAAGATSSGASKLTLTKKLAFMIIGSVGIVATIFLVSLGAESNGNNNQQNSAESSFVSQQSDEQENYEVSIPVKDIPAEVIEPEKEQVTLLTMVDEEQEDREILAVAPAEPQLARRDTVHAPVPMREVVLRPFNSLKIEGIFDVIIEQGAQEKMVVEGDKDSIVFTEYYGDQLMVSSANFRGGTSKEASTLVIRITVRNLNVLEVNGIGNVTVSQLESQSLYVIYQGVGDLTMNLSCKELEVESSGIGNLKLTGQSDVAKYYYTGVGDFKACELKVHHVVAEGSGIGNMHVYADVYLEIDGDGVGDIWYSGNPAEKVLHYSGIGAIKSEQGQ